MRDKVTAMKLLPNCSTTHIYLCLVHVIWTNRRMSKLLLNVKYLLSLSFLTAAEFYNLGHIQGITYKGALTQKR